MENNSLSQFYRKSISERLGILMREHIVDRDTAQSLQNDTHMLTSSAADRMIENVIGVFGLPMGLGLNLKINGKEYVVPMIVEEPSIIAAVGSAAKLVESAGGFQTESERPVMTGQIVVEQAPNPDNALKSLLERQKDILSLANSLHPNLVARGGGALDVEALVKHDTDRRADFLVVHLLVDTCDAMGANLVNSMCEAVASMIEDITGGQVLLRILSNLFDRSIVRAKLVVPPEGLEKNGFSGNDVRDRIISAGRFAELDVYRATTHNKGIMNGIDAVAIATGNDWRSIEAAAHAYAAQSGRYQPLTRWESDADGHLIGRIALPIKVGTVGGSLESNPSVKLALRMLKVDSARELAEVMAAVGLAQNLAALRALVTEGIQKGHMSLHARSVAQAAGAGPAIADEVVARLIATGDIKVQKARDIISDIRAQGIDITAPQSAATSGSAQQSTASAPGKFILLGEHAALYGSRAIAAPLEQAIYARIIGSRPGIHLVVPDWGIDTAWQPNTRHRDSILKSIDHILMALGITRPAIRIELFPKVPRAMGLGSSAAAAVAVVRALSDHYRLSLSNRQVNNIAYESERIIHGRSSGVDNTVSAYGLPLIYRPGEPPHIAPIDVPEPIPLLIGLSRRESLTAPMVAKIQKAWQKDGKRYSAIFNAIDERVAEAVEAIRRYDLVQLGRLLNENHDLLKSLDVSTYELDQMVNIARHEGALGAKITGGGGGGAVMALCPQNVEKIIDAFHANGWKTIAAEMHPPGEQKKRQLSFEPEHQPTDRLIVVDEYDHEIGSCTRKECHADEGIRHRAFSIFIFDTQGRLLLQKRSREKELWPLYWSNSCCSHPRIGESMYDATQRRLTEELGISTPLTYAFQFAYQARFNEIGSENELCSVWIGQTDQPIRADAREIEEYRYVSLSALEAEINESPERFTPWFKLEWERLRHHPLVKAYQKEASVTQKNPSTVG